MTHVNRTARRGRARRSDISALRHVLRASALGMLAALVQATAVDAQQGRPAFLAIPEAFPPIEARAIVVRERGRDVVFLHRDHATPEAVEMSLRVLRDASDRTLRPGQGEMIPITGYGLLGEMPAVRRAQLLQLLGRLESAPAEDTGSFGPARSIPLGIR